MLSSFVLSFFSLGCAGGIIGSFGMTDAVNSQSTASLFFTNSSYSLLAFGFTALGPIKQTSSESCLSSSDGLFLLLR